MSYEGNSIFWVEVEKIVPNPYQPRREFDEQKLRELGESIRMYGLLQPLTVTRKEIVRDDGSFTSEYELIAGERRLRASKLAGLTQVPVIIRSEEEDELMKLELAIIENLQREDLNAVDRALAFRQLADQFSLSHTEIAKKMGRSREYVSNTLRLLQLPETILGGLRSGDISDGHARTLLMLNDKPEEQDTVYREILLKKLSVREVEQISRKIASDKVRKQELRVDPQIIIMEKRFMETLGTRVQIAPTDYGGRVTIDYFSEDDLEKLFTLINTEKYGGVDANAVNLDAVTQTTPLEQVRSEVAQFETVAAREIEDEYHSPVPSDLREENAPHSDTPTTATPDTASDGFDTPSNLPEEKQPHLHTPPPTSTHHPAAPTESEQPHVNTIPKQDEYAAARTTDAREASDEPYRDTAEMEHLHPAVSSEYQNQQKKSSEQKNDDVSDDADLYSIKNFTI